MVLVAVAILTALAVQLAYDTRVELQLAGNARDRLRAEYLARSGVNLSRLVLSLQQQLDAASGGGPARGPNTKTPAGGGAPQALQSAVQGLGAIPSLRIWSAVPVNSGLVQALFGGGPAPDAAAPREGDAPPPARFGDFEGMFAADIEDEGAKVDAQLDSAYSTGLLSAQVLGLWQLVCDPRWDPLFEREDANGTKITRQDLLVNLHDWTDDNEQTSALVASFPGAACLAEIGRNPFENHFGDENFPYDRGEDRYRAKNHRFDSLEELYLVAGVSDAFMAAFGDRLTVYLKRDAKSTVDPRNPKALWDLAFRIADPQQQQALFDPQFPVLLQRAVLEQTMGGVLGIGGVQFAQIVSSLGVQVTAASTSANSPQNFIGDRPSVFRIRATGAAGDVEARIDAVVTFDPTQTRGGPPPGQNPGRLVRWREE
jgi:general secretion pathway protein K